MQQPQRMAAIALVLTASLVASGSASACRMEVPPAVELADYTTVVLATVTKAKRLDTPGWNRWRVTAQGRLAISGSPDLSIYEFKSGLSSDGCGRTPLPPRGERWVLYLRASDPHSVSHAFPLEYVRDYDGRLKALP